MVSRRDFLRGRLTPKPAKDGPRIAVIGGNCMAFKDVVCRSCGDACGEAAIRFSPRLGGAALPEVQAALCTGCGDCASACPAGAVTMAAAGGNP
jgi:ferredoxin-type protein NapF